MADSVIVYGQTVTLNDGADTSLADALATIRKDDNWGDWEWVQGYIAEVIAAVQSSPELFQQYADAEAQLP